MAGRGSLVKCSGEIGHKIDFSQFLNGEKFGSFV